MTNWIPAAGATVLIPSGPTGHHLFIVLNDPTEIPDCGVSVCVAMVNFSSIKQGVPYDSTCEVAAGEHRFLTRASFVEYRHARIERAEDLVLRVKQGLFISHDPLTEALLQRVKSGLNASPFTKRAFKNLPI